MGLTEWEFSEDIRSSRKMYNEDFIDNAWQPSGEEDEVWEIEEG